VNMGWFVSLFAPKEKAILSYSEYIWHCPCLCSWYSIKLQVYLYVCFLLALLDAINILWHNSNSSTEKSSGVQYLMRSRGLQAACGLRAFVFLCCSTKVVFFTPINP
jgi:hypothetical protein